MRAYGMPRCIGRQRPQLVPDRLGPDRGRGVRPAVAPPVAESSGQGQQDLDVVAGALRPVEGLADALDAPLRVGHRALGLAPRRGGRKHHVGHLRRLGEEDVLHDQVIEAAAAAPGAGDVGFGLGRVLAEAVHRPQLALLHGVEHGGEVLALAGAGWWCPMPGRTWPVPRRRRSPGTRAGGRGWHPCPRRPGRCSGLAAG